MESPKRATAKLAQPDIVRLWIMGGTNNVVRWFEVLAAALFTFEITHSGLAVAAVSAARSLPMFLFGAFSGVLSEAVNRKTIIVTGIIVTASTSIAILALSIAGAAQPWHIAVAAFVCGSVWSTDMSSRRRMVGDIAAPELLGRAIAVDSLAGATTRMIGPLLGAVAYAQFGLTGAYAITVCLTLSNLALALPLHHHQITRRLSLAGTVRDLLDGLRSAGQQPRVLAVLAVTLVMNMFVFSYSAIIAPFARVVFDAPTSLIGFLAAAESLGALIAGIVLTRRSLPIPPRIMMVGGSVLFAVSLIAMPLLPGFWWACLLLVGGGTGTAAFSNMQTLLILNGTPPALRSRLLGLITVSIGTGPIGQLIAGSLADTIGLTAAVMTLATAGTMLLLATGWFWHRAEPSG